MSCSRMALSSLTGQSREEGRKKRRTLHLKRRSQIQQMPLLCPYNVTLCEGGGTVESEERLVHGLVNRRTGVQCPAGPIMSRTALEPTGLMPSYWVPALPHASTAPWFIAEPFYHLLAALKRRPGPAISPSERHARLQS
jgi:hypothetical protein